MKYIKQFESFAINEIFGLSKKEKEAKKLKEDIKKAKSEVSAFDITLLFRETDNFSKEHREKLARIIFKNANSAMPTVAKLLPSMFNETSGMIDASYKKMKGVVPSKFHFALTSLTDTQLSKANFSKHINAELDKL
jgi:hypothetical protein